MKFINRTVKFYDYTFAEVDLTTGEPKNVHKVSVTSPLSPAAKAQISNEHNGAFLVNMSQHYEKYTLPVDYFIKSCREYSEQVRTETVNKIHQMNMEDKSNG